MYCCIDIFTNRVIFSIVRIKPIQTNDIVKKPNQAINKRLPIKPIRELIIYIDRGTQFISKFYYIEILLNKEKVIF